MFGTIGGQELFLILVLALIVFGPRKLPEIGRSLGRMMMEFRRASNDFKRTIEEEVEAEKLRAPEPPPAPSPVAVPPDAESTPQPDPVPAAVSREAPPTPEDK